jgi:hypothetical protein
MSGRWLLLLLCLLEGDGVVDVVNVVAAAGGGLSGRGGRRVAP